MAADDVFPAEMPDTPYDPIAPPVGALVDGVVLDGDTVERLLAGRHGRVPQEPPPRQGALPPGHRGPRQHPDHRGLWIADGARAPLGVLSSSGSGPAWRAALPPVGSKTGTGGGGSPLLPSTRERAIAGHGGGGPSRAGGSAGGVRPTPPAKGQAAKPPKPPQAKAGKAKPGKAGKAGTAGQGGGRRN